MTLIFKRKNSGIFKISSLALEQIMLFKQTSYNSLEAGGVLLGYYFFESDDIKIEKVSIPMSGDIRSKKRFFRKENSHQKIINNAWKESNGTCVYLGEWHTHPEKNPNPSFTDILSWKEKLKTVQFEEEYLFFVIVGIKRISVWEGNKINLMIKKLEEIK